MDNAPMRHEVDEPTEAEKPTDKLKDKTSLNAEEPTIDTTNLAKHSHDYRRPQRMK
jgi:hypothetical protein